jgi:AraC-like DNA-binding protein
MEEFEKYLQRIIASLRNRSKAANAVGYENAFTFSTSYKKWIGWRP